MNRSGLLYRLREAATVEALRQAAATGQKCVVQARQLGVSLRTFFYLRRKHAAAILETQGQGVLFERRADM